MTRGIETRLKRLESKQQDHDTVGDAVISFYKDGVFVGAQRNGEPYDGPLEGHRIVSRVNFVSARHFEEDEE